MRYILIENPGPHSRLIISQQDLPIPEKDKLLVRVRATAINRADLLQRQGKYPPPPGESEIPGLEVAGDVVALGEEVDKFKMGDRIYGLVSSGAYADYCMVHPDLAASMPDNWDYSYAAAIPEALMTAHATVFLLGKLKQNDRFLIHAAGSGISSFAIQMAGIVGAKVYTTTSSEEKRAKAAQLGSVDIINYNNQDFQSQLGEQSLDLIVDFIGGSYFPIHLNLLKPRGRLVQIAMMQGRHVDCDLAFLVKKRLKIMGFVLRPQTLAEKTILWKSAQKQWSQYLLDKKIVPIIDSKFSFEDIELAHAHMLSSNHFGKIVIGVD